MILRHTLTNGIYIIGRDYAYSIKTGDTFGVWEANNDYFKLLAQKFSDFKDCTPYLTKIKEGIPTTFSERWKEKLGTYRKLELQTEKSFKIDDGYGYFKSIVDKDTSPNRPFA